MKTKKIILSILLLFTILLTTSCEEQNSYNNSYDGKVFDISTSQNKQLNAKIKKIGTDYELTITGTGNARDYTKKEEVPWNSIAKKINKVEIENGIRNIGDYYFNAIPLTTYYIPESIEEIAENSFNPQAVIYSYRTQDIVANCQNKVYTYSDTKPEQNKIKWRMVGETPLVWDTHKILFIGNSFTFYPIGSNLYSESKPAIPTITNELAKSLNIDLTIHHVVKGSYTLKKFADEKDDKGKIVDEYLKANDDYDFVILQEQSTTPANDYNSFNQAVQKLTKKINETQKNAQIILYATWGFPSAITDKGVYKTVGEMELKIRNAYEQCATENELKISYVGKAFTYVYENYTDIKLYGGDSKHQSVAGAYLSASIHLATMLNVDVRAACYIGTLDENTATTLRDVAYDTVFNQ